MPKVKTLRSNLPLLEKFSISNDREKKKLCKHYRNEICKCMRLIAHNLLEKNIPITEENLNKLRPHEKSIRLFASPKISNKKKLKSLNQTGGALLPILIPAVASLIGELIARKI